MTDDQTALILDVDGTLVDSNYQHALAWFRAMRQHGHVATLWELHRHIGMGGDQLVSAVLGEDVEREQGDDIRAAHSALYLDMIEEVEPLPGARQLLRDLAGSTRRVVLASSAKADEVDHYLDLLEARDVVDGWTTSADVAATKPEPDLVQAALGELGGGPALMIGDSVYDCEAAGRADVPCVGLLTGGFSEQELRGAGARAVHRTAEELRRELGLAAT